VWVRVPVDEMPSMLALGYKTDIIELLSMPSGYEDYHDYAEQKAMLDELNVQYPDLTKVFSIGQSIEDRDL
jgi:hypothetical protein